ncbi:MAG: SDR family NAD(P)-dependent oxidoreductase [Sporichthyaceae bacterium]
MTDLRFDGEVALVTGAGRGIGRAHALELARRGALVVVNDAEADPAALVVAEIAALGGRAVANQDSVSTPEGGAAMVAQAIGEFGRLDVVVNNAGILRDKAFGNLTPELLDPVIDVHLRGAFHVLVPAWAHMKERGYGRIVNTGSGSGMFGNFGQANYGAAKAGLWGLTRVLAIEGRKVGIKANLIVPAAKTRMNAALFGDSGDRLTPESVSPVVAYLAHRECDVTGQALSVGGGRVAALLVALTPGIAESDLRAESVRDRLAEILDPAGSTYPRHVGDELKAILAEFVG